ncbi:Exportin-4 [Entophlyctis luteolus]|nr:Exportin-4 [Entophlyctis luteolus]
MADVCGGSSPQQWHSPKTSGFKCAGSITRGVFDRSNFIGNDVGFPQHLSKIFRGAPVYANSSYGIVQEAELLKLFYMVMDVLHDYTQNPQLEFAKRYVDIAVRIMSWEFASRETNLIESQLSRASTSGRFPASWSASITRPEVVDVVFALHTKLQGAHVDTATLVSLVLGVSGEPVFTDVASEASFVAEGMRRLNRLLSSVIGKTSGVRPSPYEFSGIVEMVCVIPLKHGGVVGSVLRMINQDLVLAYLESSARFTLHCLSVSSMCFDAHVGGDAAIDESEEWEDSVVCLLLDMWAQFVEQVEEAARYNTDSHVMSIRTALKQYMPPVFAAAIDLRLKFASHSVERNDEELDDFPVDEQMSDTNETGNIDWLNRVAVVGRFVGEDACRKVQQLTDNVLIGAAKLIAEGRVNDPQREVLLEQLNWIILLAAHLLADTEIGETPLVPDALVDLSMVAYFIENVSILPAATHAAMVRMFTSIGIRGGTNDVWFLQVVDLIKNRLFRVSQRPDFIKVHQTASVKTEVINVMEMLEGVCQSADYDTATRVLSCLMTYLESLSRLFHMYRKITEVNFSILKVFAEMAKILALCEPSADTRRFFYSSYTSILKDYANANIGERTIDEDDRVESLIVVLETLRDLILVETRDEDRFDVVYYGVNMIFPLVNSEILKASFDFTQSLFELLVLIVCHFPEKLVTMEPEVVENVLAVLRLGITAGRVDMQRLALDAVMYLGRFCSLCANTQKSTTLSESFIAGVDAILGHLFQYMLYGEFDPELSRAVAETFYVLVVTRWDVYGQLAQQVIDSQVTQERKLRLSSAFNLLTQHVEALAATARSKGRLPSDLDLVSINDVAEYCAAVVQFLNDVRGFLRIQ